MQILIIRNTINTEIKMDIKDIENQLKIKNLQVALERDYKKKQKLRDDIQTLNFKKQIELIRDKIKRMTR